MEQWEGVPSPLACLMGRKRWMVSDQVESRLGQNWGSQLYHFATPSIPCRYHAPSVLALDKTAPKHRLMSVKRGPGRLRVNGYQCISTTGGDRQMT